MVNSYETSIIQVSNKQPTGCLVNGEESFQGPMDAPIETTADYEGAAQGVVMEASEEEEDKEMVELYRVEYYLNYHYRNEQETWKYGPRNMSPVVFDYLSHNLCPQFQRQILNYFLLLLSANDYYRYNLLTWEISTYQPIFLADLYQIVDSPLLRLKAFSNKNIITSKSKKKEYTVFRNIRIWDYKQYMDEIYLHYGNTYGFMPEPLFDYFFQENRFDENLCREFLEWYVPLLESLLACMFMNVFPLNDSKTLLRRFYSSQNIRDLKYLFCQK